MSKMSEKKNKMFWNEFYIIVSILNVGKESNESDLCRVK